jgi:DNA-binding winged helix-turn-helix (wHTH) protein
MKHFLAYRFDERERTLWRGTEEIRLTRKASAILLCLIEGAGRIVTHETILASVWPGTHVQADNIKVLVHEIRAALQDDSRDPRFIRSEPGRGYSFIAPVLDAALPQTDARDSAISSIFVNHHDDLAKLKCALTDPSRTDCRVILVEGERGMGKTALCDAFMQLAREVPSVRICYGQSVAHAGKAEPYQPIADALHHLSRQSPATMPGLLSQYAPTWLTRLPPWIADAAPPTDESLSEPSRMLREVSALLEAMALEATTVIVLDDLHWADLETVELLRALARWHAPLRTMILATYSPGATTVTAAALRSLAAELRATGPTPPMMLGPLQEDHVRTYLTKRFGGGSIEALARMVHRLSGGNPLVMVSAMDALINGGSIVIQGDSWRLRHSPRTIERSLPSSAQDLILWRFDQLESDDRAVLESAAAVGSEFCAADVAKAAGAESSLSIVRRLETLSDRGFISRRGKKASGPPAADGVYRFDHPLHAQLLAGHAPVFDQLRAKERLASEGGSHQRFG